MSAPETQPCVPVNGTVGCGTLGFGGLSWTAGVYRWIQATEAPDLMLPEVVKWLMPLMLVLMVVECVTGLLIGRNVYYLRQAWSNVAAGSTMYMLLGIFIRGLTIFPYMVVHKYLAINRSRGFFTHVLAFLGTDLGYYMGHWFTHATNVGWASHNMHHSSPDFNFLTALRLGQCQLLVIWMFYVPTALVAPVDLFFFYYGVMYFFQFLTHTQLVGKLHPVIEYIFNTPSNHRVHHARNYPRSNYGAMLMIWDHMFGTYVCERDDRPCVFGLDERQIPLGTHNPEWQQGHHWWFTFKGAMQAKGMDKLRVLFTRKHVEGMIMPAVTDSTDDKVPPPPGGVPCDNRLSKIDAYVVVHGALCFLPTVYVYYCSASLPLLHTIAVCAALVLSYSTLLTLFDETNGRTASRNEIIRLFIVAMMGFWMMSNQHAILLAAFCMISAIVIDRITVSKVNVD